MRALIETVKTCVVGGFFGILPVLLFVLLLGEAIDLLGAVTEPIVEGLPVEELGGIEVASLVAIGLIVAACFLAGLLLRTRFGTWSSRLVEGAVLSRLPGYTLLRSVTRRLGGLEEGSLFAPALADIHGTGANVLAFIVEDHDDGRFTLFVPNAPTPTIGTLYVVPGERLQRIPATPGSVVNTFMQWGIGSKQLLRA